MSIVPTWSSYSIEILIEGGVLLKILLDFEERL